MVHVKIGAGLPTEKLFTDGEKKKEKPTNRSEINTFLASFGIKNIDIRVYISTNKTLNISKRKKKSTISCGKENIILYA